MNAARESRVRRCAQQYGYDGGCIVPGCRRKVRLHHIVPRAKGGGNALANLMPICYTHESALHRATGKLTRLEQARQRAETLIAQHQELRKTCSCRVRYVARDKGRMVIWDCKTHGVRGRGPSHGDNGRCPNCKYILP